MRYAEIASGVRVVLNNEEQGILDKAGEGGIITGFQNDARKKELVHQMIGKGILTLHKIKGKPVVAVNSINDIWRDR
jgi:hypothetical protein